MALSKLHLCGLIWVAWTDFGSVGVGRRAILTQIDNFRQGPGHPRVDPVESANSNINNIVSKSADLAPLPLPRSPMTSPPISFVLD